jgi:hypothetical protein
MERVYTFIDLAYDCTVGSALRSVATLVSDKEPVETVVTNEPILQTSTESSKEETEVEKPQTFKAVASLIEERAASADLAKSIAYVGSTRVPLFSAPTKEFDTVVTNLSYGTMVMVLEEKGRFSKVAVDGNEGWVLRDDLSDRAAYVYPEFVIGEENGVDDPNTLRLRACIKDEFNGIESEVALQAGEYILYKLMRKGKSITWPSIRPRTPGRWHVILRGLPGIRISITPRSGTVMECIFPNDIGHLAYVEAVFPDERITISEVNYPDHGIYNERTLTKEEWQALNPVFIEVSQ